MMLRQTTPKPHANEGSGEDEAEASQCDHHRILDQETILRLPCVHFKLLELCWRSNEAPQIWTGLPLSIPCPACTRLRFVNCKTGKMPGRIKPNVFILNGEKPATCPSSSQLELTCTSISRPPSRLALRCRSRCLAGLTR